MICAFGKIKMAEKRPKPCKRRKSDTLEEAVNAGLALLAKEKGPKQPQQRKPSHFHLVQFGSERLTHTPYRSRRGSSKRNDNNQQKESSAVYDDFETDDGHIQMDIDIDEELEHLISECTGLLDSGKESTGTKKWSDRIEEIHSVWEDNRSLIFETLIQHESVIEAAPCFNCEENPGLIRCHECGDNWPVCYECDRKVHHEKPLHNRQGWFDNHFRPLQPSYSLDENGQMIDVDCYVSFHPVRKLCVGCSRESTFYPVPSNEMLTVFTSQGRFDINSTVFRCHSCSSSSMLTLADVLGNGYWPSNPKSLNVLFSQDLFLLWNTMQKRMPGCSESSFIRSLEDIGISKGRFGSINPRTFTKAFREWKYFNYEVEKTQAKEWMFCPSCSSNQHSCHVDGNMKLYRYKHSGRVQSQSYYGDLFISSNTQVAEHLKKVYSSPQAQNFADDGKCGETNWRAAGNKGKRKSHLDETGLEIAGCRHAVAQWAVNMFRGEIYGYSNYIHVHKMIPNNVKYIWQDIICKYWKWALKTLNSDESKTAQIKPALSVMHAKAHNWTCQVLWGGRWQEGTGYSTGEEVEQINSYLSRLSNTTKYMLPEAREELITEHALAWNKRKICDMSNALCKRYVKYVKAQDSTRKELDEIVSSVNLSQDDIDFLQWKSDVQLIAKELESTSFSYTSEEEECYVLTSAITDTPLLPSSVNPASVDTEAYLRSLSRKTIEKYSTIDDKRRRVNVLTAKLCGDITVDVLLDRGKKLFLENALKCVQNELEMLSFAIAQRKASIAKLGSSAKVRTKLRQKMSTDQKSIDKKMHMFNILQLAAHPEAETIPLDECSVVDGMFPWTLNDMSVRLKCKIVDKFEHLKRLDEELILLKQEMLEYLKYYKDIVIPKLKTEIKDLEQNLNTDTVSVKDTCESSSDQDVESEKSLYVSSCCKSRGVTLGEIALRYKGINFAKQQLHCGSKNFSSIYSGDVLNTFVSTECDLDSNEDNEDNDEIDVDDSDDEMINEDITLDK